MVWKVCWLLFWVLLRIVWCFFFPNILVSIWCSVMERLIVRSRGVESALINVGTWWCWKGTWLQNQGVKKNLCQKIQFYGGFVALNTWIPFWEEKTCWERGFGELKGLQMWNHVLEHGLGERRLLWSYCPGPGNENGFLLMSQLWANCVFCVNKNMQKTTQQPSACHEYSDLQ